MFLNLLNDRQKASFLALATKVVMADGGVVPEEDVTLDIRRYEMGGDISAPPDEIFGVPNTEIFDTRRSQVIVLAELYVLAYSDSDFHADERPIIQELAEAWGFSEDDCAGIEQWAVRQGPLSLEAWTVFQKLDAV